MDAAKTFLDGTVERADLNQYWFSQPTLSTFVEECDVHGSSALVSSPSVYFSLPEERRRNCKVFDFDRQWDSDPGFVFYDFHQPEDLPEALRGAFSFVLIDPPFITREVWEKYAITARFLACEGARILCTTIAENAQLMAELLDLHPVLYRPGIPNLVYQYSIYVNYESDRLNELNPEIDQENWQATAQSVLCGQLDEKLEAPLLSRAGQKSAGEGEGAGATPAGYLATESFAPEVPVEDVAEVQLLLQLRKHLMGVKRAIEGLQAPLLMAQRRTAMGGLAASAAADKADAAKDAAGAALDQMEAFLREHISEASVWSLSVLCCSSPERQILFALGEGSAASAASAGDDRWHSPLGSTLASPCHSIWCFGFGPRRSARALLECQGQGGTQGQGGAVLDEMRRLSAAFFGQSRQARLLHCDASVSPEQSAISAPSCNSVSECVVLQEKFQASNKDKRTYMHAVGAGATGEVFVGWHAGFVHEVATKIAFKAEDAELEVLC
ncbi:EEF1AKMT1 [Symbiodinium sp. CCMP2456]|nr:EEF1AKMT1 [Symbiodinium sp. CCMP2456]